MPQYPSYTLSTLVSMVLARKPNAQQSEVVRSINSRIREVVNVRLYWSDLLVRRIISIPAAYNTGTVSYTTGSTIVTGIATAWPVSDAVNTTSTVAVTDAGYQEITPSSMTGIAVDSMLFCDAGGTPETVAVTQVTPVSFWAKFSSAHTTSFTITSSSLAGLQIYTGSSYPMFTVRSIRSSTQLEIDQPWGGPPVSAIQYQILKAYTTIDPNLKVILKCVDQQQGAPLDIYVSLEQVLNIDPQLSSTGDPEGLVQWTPTEAGSMQYLIYPIPTNARQLFVIAGLSWPELSLENDLPPFFIDPSVFVDGAIADMLRIRNIKYGPASDGKDPWFDPGLANQFEMKFMRTLELAKGGDNAKAQRDFQSAMDWLPGANSKWALGHDIDLLQGRF